MLQIIKINNDLIKKQYAEAFLICNKSTSINICYTTAYFVKKRKS